MSKFKAKKKQFFRSGLALLGEKKVYEKILTTAAHISQPASVVAGSVFKWDKV